MIQMELPKASIFSFLKAVLFPDPLGPAMIQNIGRSARFDGNGERA